MLGITPASFSFKCVSAAFEFFVVACSFPFDYVKTLIQKMQPDAKGKFPYTGSFDCTMKTLKARWPFKFYTSFPVYCEVEYELERIGSIKVLETSSSQANESRSGSFLGETPIPFRASLLFPLFDLAEQSFLSIDSIFFSSNTFLSPFLVSNPFTRPEIEQQKFVRDPFGAISIARIKFVVFPPTRDPTDHKYIHYYFTILHSQFNAYEKN